MNKKLWLVIAVVLGSLFIFWLPFVFRLQSFWGIVFGGQGMEIIIQNFDGLNYAAIAKTLYDPELLTNQFSSFGNTPLYFAAHYPGLPLVIRFFDIFLSFPRAMMASIILGNLVLGWGLVTFFRHIAPKNALLLSLIACFFPARMLSVRSVVATEPFFVGLVLISLTLFAKRQNWLATVAAAAAVFFRAPGILLFAAYTLAILVREKYSIGQTLKSMVPFLLIPATLAVVWLGYYIQLGDFWAHFRSGDNIHLFFPPFQIFSNVQTWVTDMWLEDVIYLYVFVTAGMLLLLNKVKSASEWRPVLIFAGLYGISVASAAHRDIARYSLPLAPLALVGYERFMEHKWGRWLCFLLLPIYLWGWRFVLANIQPISDWSVLL